VSYRDDHEAALARAAALQKELDDEKARDEKKTERIAELETELAAARARVTELENKLPPEPARPAAASEPPIRESMTSIVAEEATFPDDGAMARQLRKIDTHVGTAEQAVLFALLIAVVVSGAFQGLASKLAGKSYPATYEIVRTGVLSIAMIGAAFASHQQRHLAMDLISRRLPPRGRLVLQVFLGLITIFITAVLVRSVWHLFAQVSQEHNANALLPAWVAPVTLPLGGGLIIFHTLLHLVIDVDYLARRKLPPERVRSAH
jgi:TRAP-type C4-dicarboxylate transport system permease small subunit